MNEPKQATIEATWPSGKKETIPVSFNPTEYTLDKSVQLAEIAIPGLDTPIIQFVRGQNEKMSLELFFDTTEKGGMGEDAVSVTTETDSIYQLVKIEPNSHAPPICTFNWNQNFPGDNVSDVLGNQKRNGFKFIVESVSQKFTLFSAEGVPLRATLTLNLREYKTLDEQLEQLNLNSPDRTHSHVVKVGETLSFIAGQHYLRPGAWRHIAEKNNIDDPRRIAPGTFLAVPPITQ